MRVTFLGVGAALDEQRPTAAILVQGPNLLLDCGYDAPAQVWKHNPQPDFLDGIYVSHQHADHSFGIPALLYRMTSDGRTKPLTILGLPGTKKHIQQLIALSYPDMPKTYPLRFLEIARRAKWNGFTLEIAKSRHPVPNGALKLSDGSRQSTR